MTIARVSSSGRVTIPLEVCQRLAIGPGSTINFRFAPDGRCVMEPVGASLKSLEGVLHRASQEPVSLTEMQSAIESAAVSEDGIIGR